METIEAVGQWVEGMAGDDADDNLMVEGGTLVEHKGLEGWEKAF